MTMPSVPAEPLNPWKSIWQKPRETFRQLLDAPRDKKREMILLAAAGASHALGNILWDEKHDAIMSSNMRFVVIALAMLIGAGLTVLLMGIGTKITAWLFRKIFKGTATGEQLYTVYAWASIPAVILLPFTLFFILAFPTSASVQGAGAFLALPFSLGVIVLSLWQVVMGIFGVAEAQGWSFWKALGYSFLLGLIIAVAIAIVVVPLFMIFGTAAPTGTA
jgi:hypothetical protein